MRLPPPGICSKNRNRLPSCEKEEGNASLGALRQRLGAFRSVGARPVQLTCRLKYDVLSVGAPYGVGIHSRTVAQARLAAPLPIVHPDVCVGAFGQHGRKRLPSGDTRRNW